MSNYTNRGTTTPLAPCEHGRVTTPIFYSSEQGTLPTTFLISKQVIPYRTCGGICYPGVSTPITRSLIDSSMTNHITWQILTVSTISNLAQTTATNLTTSPHIMTDGRPTLSTLNISQTQHHEDGKTCTTLMTAGLSNTTNHKNSILKYESLGN
jgi:hypothetical protein